MKLYEYKETAQRGSPSFPVQYYYVDKTHPRYVMPLHWQSEFEIIRVTRGRLRLFINNELLIGEPGAVFFISPGILHRAEPIDCIYECVVFDVRLISGYEASAISRYIRPILSGELEVKALCESARETADEVFAALAVEWEYFELYTASLLYKLFYELYISGCISATAEKSKSTSRRQAQMILLLDKLDKEYTEPISLSALAELAGLNEKYLFRIFKEYTGSTPVQYINRLRIDRACHEMAINSLSVTDAAYASGFNELSYFSKVFKKYKGITPGQYRERCLDKNK